MSRLTRSLRKFLTGEQYESYEERLARMRLAGAGVKTPQVMRIEQLEDDLARAVLLVHTLAEACIEKDVFTREEIAATAAQIDLIDGAADGKLDPAVMRPRPSQ